MLYSIYAQDSQSKGCIFSSKGSEVPNKQFIKKTAFVKLILKDAMTCNDSFF